VVEQERETVRAQARWVHSSARKARLVTDLIRGRSVPEARTILAFSTRAVAKDVDKVLRSAVAHADEGPTLKRWRARARGRVARIRKRTCHITIELAQGAPTSAAPAVPAMAPPEPEPVEEPEAVEETETEPTEEPEATEEQPEAADEPVEEPEAEAETPETEEGPSDEAEAEASTEETDR
jgi:large subunit ribosomal protein L22